MIEWFDICVNEQVYLIMCPVSVYHRLNDEKSLNLQINGLWPHLGIHGLLCSLVSAAQQHMLRYEDHHQMLAVTCIQRFPGKCYVSQLWHIEILGTVHIVDSVKGNWGISRIVWEKETISSSEFQSGFSPDFFHICHGSVPGALEKIVCLGRFKLLLGQLP